jgi:amino acid adenylation domain-containing protein
VGSIDVANLRRAWDEVVQQHEILRTTFQLVDEVPMQRVLPSLRELLSEVDLRHLGSSERASRFSSLTAQQVEKPFDLTQDSLVRATLFRLADREHAFLLVSHRAICDEWSLRVLLREIYSRYMGSFAGESLETGKSGLEQRNANSGKNEPSDLSYWLRHLAGAPLSLDLPTDRPRPSVQTFRSARQRMRIEGQLMERLRDLQQKKDVPLFVLLLAGFSVLASRYARQEDLIIGTRVSGRQGPELEKQIGPLENMLALRFDLSEDPSFAELLIRVREVVDKAVSHQKVAFGTLVRELHLERDMSRHPLFQIMIAMEDAAALNPDLGAGASLLKVENAAGEFDLSVNFVEVEDHREITFCYNTDLFDDSTITRMMRHFRILLESAAENPHTQISRMPVLSDGERHQMLVEWNHTAAQYERDQCVHQRFERWARRSPDSTAVVFETQQLSYGELDRRANQLANYLRKLGVQSDGLVGVCLDRSLDMVVGLLGVLKAGAAYVPIDPAYPVDRIRFMLEDAEVPVLLTQQRLAATLPVGRAKVVLIDSDWQDIAKCSQTSPGQTTKPENRAYVIYTSGSTGRPKGVEVLHRAVVNFLTTMAERPGMTSEDRLLAVTTLSFDIAGLEIYLPLTVGGSVEIASREVSSDGSQLRARLASSGATITQATPATWRMLLEAGWEGSRGLKVLCGGEALPRKLADQLLQSTGSLWNMYGPTETTIWSTISKVEPGPRAVTIGRPIANTQVFILDKALQPVPIGVAGELHIGGDGLARGYLKQPELTAEKFITHPFSHHPGDRLYKTGDLARFLPDGKIEYLGRIDFQVKLRGFRIELGEIEAVLGKSPEVLHAVAVVREDNPGDQRLVAYLMAKPEYEIDLEKLRKEIKDKLPEFMIPSLFVVVERFPLTGSGKVDRKALPAPNLKSAAVSTLEPRNALESKLASLFASVLGLPSVGVSDNFFDLGGHSLLAGRLLARVNEMTGRRISLSALFRGATVESLARVIETESEIAPDSVAMEIQHGDSSRLPFFAIVPPGEESLGYAMLARHMGPEQTVVKVQAQAPVVVGRPYREQEMRMLTAEYIAAMRSVQRHGPYCLGGLCDGTHIAERIVMGLEALGEEVAFFAIFDTWVLQHSQRPLLWKLHYLRERMRETHTGGFTTTIGSYIRVLSNKVLALLARQDRRTDWQQAYWPENFEVPRFRAPVLLFKRPKQPFYYIKDPQMGWGKRSQGGVEIHELDFHHLHILREPQVRFFGEKVSEHIEMASRNNLKGHRSQESSEAPLWPAGGGYRDEQTLQLHPTPGLPPQLRGTDS